MRRLARRWAVLSVALIAELTVGTNKQRRSEAVAHHCGGCTPQWPAPLCAAAESAPDDFVKKVVPVIQDRINRRAVRPTCNVVHCSAAVPIEDRAHTCAVLPTVATPRRAPGLSAAVLEYSCHPQQTNGTV